MADEALKERYRKAMPLLAELLHIQKVFINDLRLVKDGKINARALGYIYGITDAGFQIAELDVGSEYGMGVLMALIMEFDERNADILFQYLQLPGDPRALMEGISLGVDDYVEWADAKTRRPAIRWKNCFDQ